MSFPPPWLLLQAAAASARAATVVNVPIRMCEAFPLSFKAVDLPLYRPENTP
jgi:hypothetical protein